MKAYKPLFHLFLFIAISSLAACSNKDLCKGKGKSDCACYEIYAPVCGCDEVTYPNDCYAECNGIMEYTEGECGSTTPCETGPVIEDCMCTMEYDPVCGCDNKTYSNACAAGCNGVPSHTKGACK